MEAKILHHIEDGVHTIILNYPSKLNCMGTEMLVALQEALDRVENERARTVIFRGAGDRAFSTGADIAEFKSLGKKGLIRWIEKGNLLFNRIENLKCPTIALIDGYAMGGGLELALCCDFRLGTASAILCSPEMAHGWLPGWGGIARLRRIIGEANAKKMVLLGERIDVQEGLTMGLITKILESDNEEGQLMDFVGSLVKLDPDMYAVAKTALMNPFRRTTGLDLEFDVMAALRALSK